MPFPRRQPRSATCSFWRSPSASCCEAWTRRVLCRHRLRQHHHDRLYHGFKTQHNCIRTSSNDSGHLDSIPVAPLAAQQVYTININAFFPSSRGHLRESIRCGKKGGAYAVACSGAHQSEHGGRMVQLDFLIVWEPTGCAALFEETCSEIVVASNQQLLVWVLF